MKKSSINEKLELVFYDEMSDIFENLEEIEKAKQKKSFKTWLLYEYGLDVLLPYLDENQIDLKEGRRWESLRGSEKALKMALKWLGFEKSVVECSGKGKAFYKYQIDLGRKPSKEEVEKILGIARLSSAHRDILARIYIKDFDIRNLELSSSNLGASMLSSFSGVQEHGVKQAFERGQICQ